MVQMTTLGTAPQIGVTGAQDVIEQGTMAGLETLGSGLGRARAAIDEGNIGLEQQAALAGLRGNEAQQQAYQDFNESPGQAFLREQAERAVTRGASATGGLSGGNVLSELQRQAIGLAQQDFANQFQRGQQVLGNQQQQAQNLANLEYGAGSQGAGMISNAAGQLGQQRFAAGQQLANTAQQQANLQAQLQQQLGNQLGNVTGQTGQNISNIISGTGTNAAQLQQQLASILANIGTGSGSQIANLQSLSGQFDAAGKMGQGQAVGNAISQLAALYA